MQIWRLLSNHLSAKSSKSRSPSLRQDQTSSILSRQHRCQWLCLCLRTQAWCKWQRQQCQWCLSNSCKWHPIIWWWLLRPVNSSLSNKSVTSRCPSSPCRPGPCAPDLRHSRSYSLCPCMCRCSPCKASPCILWWCKCPSHSCEMAKPTYRWLSDKRVVIQHICRP